MAEFTQKDRDFLVKAFKQFGELDKRVKVLEGSKAAAAPLPTPLKQEAFDFKPEDAFYDESDLRAIQLTFRTPTTPENQRIREILTQTIYKAIKELCVLNGIESLNVTLENV